MPQQVLVLAMNIATYVNRGAKFNEHWLRQKYVTRQHAQLTNVSLRQLDLRQRTPLATIYNKTVLGK